MKKIFSLGLMLAALALTCCSKDAVEEQMNPAGAGAFELVADLDGGRTVADGIQTAWAVADAINVWTNVSGEKTYTSHGSFAIAEEDLATSTFRGTLAAELTEASYDWYAFYPYSQYNGYSSSSPAKTAYNKIADKAQQQDGNNNQKHIAGANAPLYGVALDVAAGEKPALQFKHLSTLVKVVVTNATDEPISIKNIKFETETEKISGTFYTTLTGDPTYQSSGDSYTYNYVNLAVTGAENIAAFDGKAEFYLNVCPFGAEAAETVTVTVTDGGDQVVTKTYTIPVGSSLSKPGKITTLNFAFDAPEEVETIADGDYVIVAEATNGYCAMSVQADGDRRAYTLLNDWNAESATYTTSDADLVWQIKAVNGGYTISNNGQYISWVSGNKAPLSSTAYTVAIAPQADGTNYITTSGGIRILAKNADAQYGFGFYETATTNGIKNLYLKPVNFVKLPDLAWGEESTAITYDDVAAHTVTVTTDATSVSVAAYDDEAYSIASTWLTTSYKDGVLTYQATNQNESADPRSAYVVATTSNENGSKVYTLVITQAGKPATGGTETTVTYDFTKIEGFSTWTTSYGQHVVTYDEATVDFTKHNRQTGTITDCPVGKGAPVTIVMTNQSTIKSVKFVCKKWTTRAQTITLHYSINGGTSYSTTGITSTNFEIESTELPAGTNAVKITFSSTNNQVGIASATLTYVK